MIDETTIYAFFFCGVLLLTVLLPFQAAAAGSDYTISKAELSAEGVVYTLYGWPMLTQYWKDGPVQNSQERRKVPCATLTGHFFLYI